MAYAALELCRKADVDDDDAVGSEEEDDFYDRTVKGGAKKQKLEPEVHDAASLFGRKVLHSCHRLNCSEYKDTLSNSP